MVDRRISIRPGSPVPGVAPQRVLMTADTVGGVWTYSLELIRALQPTGIHFALATMGRKLTDDQWEEVSGLGNVDVHESDFRLEWMDEPWADVERAGEWLKGIAAATKPELIHLNGYTHAALGWTAPVLVAAHSCVLSWWQAVRREGVPVEWKRYREAVSAGLAAADLVVAPSRSMLEALNRAYGTDFPARVAPSGRHGQQYYPRVKSPYIFIAGRLWDEAKNVAALASIAADLPWPVIAAGDGDPGAGAPSEGIRYLGRLSAAELRPWLARASIYALPARYEPFGLSVLEAALSGAALVLGDIPSLRENWDDVAFFVDPEDTEQLRTTLNRLIEKPELRRAYGVRARLRALNFSPERMATDYLQVYRSLMERRPRATAGTSDPETHRCASSSHFTR